MGPSARRRTGGWHLAFGRMHCARPNELTLEAVMCRGQLAQLTAETTALGVFEELVPPFGSQVPQPRVVSPHAHNSKSDTTSGR